MQETASPNHQYHPVQDASSKQQKKQKYKSNHQQTGLPSHSALPIRAKQTKKNSAQISPYMMLIQTTGPSLGVQKPKEEVIQPSSRKESNFPWNVGKGDLKHNKLKKIMKRQRNATQMKEQTRNTEVK